MLTAFQPSAFQNNAFQIVGGIPDVHPPQEGGPGGSNKAGKHHRKHRRPQSPGYNAYQIPWGKNSELLLELLPDETHDDQWITEVVEQYAEEHDKVISNIEMLLAVVTQAQEAYQQEVDAHELQQYKAKVVAKYRKAKRRQEDEEMLCLLICM